MKMKQNKSVLNLTPHRKQQIVAMETQLPVSRLNVNLEHLDSQTESWHHQVDSAALETEKGWSEQENGPLNTNNAE